MEALAPLLPAVVISEGAHHLDLRSANPLDPISVVRARATEVATLQKWINTWRSQTGN
jgi:lysosomal Pro-X carboxypeptidase